MDVDDHPVPTTTPATQLLFTKISDTNGEIVFVGPQGPPLANFLELDYEGTRGTFLVLGRGNKKGRFCKNSETWFESMDEPSKHWHSHDYTQTYKLSEIGDAKYKKGLGSQVVYELDLQCTGMFWRGNPNGTGSNCQKILVPNSKEVRL